MTYGCIGERLGHSFSKEIHTGLSKNPYELIELQRDEVGPFMEKRDFLAINVTIPYKETVIPYLSYIDEAARKIGAVNTVVNRDGKLYGYNTDFFGLMAEIRHAGIEVKGKKAAILGTGGTSKTAYAVLEALSAREILRVSRKATEGCIDYEMLYSEHSDTEIIINTTPVGMFPNIDATPVDLSKFRELSGCVDAVYNPLRTKFILKAQSLGIPAAGGLYMLVAQGVRASEIFLDMTYPEGTIDRIYKGLKNKKETIVLVGMPASGKSTVGKILADALSRELIDTDDIIQKKAGMAIPEIFSKYGEAHFRELEAEAVKEAAKCSGNIIATGGGAVLRDENISALRQNGRIYFIDKPLSELIPTEDRPLAKTREAIEKRYNERYSRYLSVADVRIDARSDAITVANLIREDHMK